MREPGPRSGAAAKVGVLGLVALSADAEGARSKQEVEGGRAAPLARMRPSRKRR